jgi:hypothetical protein
VTAAAVAAMLGAAAGGCALLGGPPTPSPNNPMNTGRGPSARKLAPDNDSEVRRARRLRLADRRTESNPFAERVFVWEFR